MATVTGTDGADFIHVQGDGLTPGAGQTNNTQATNGDDTITPGGGNDTVHAGGGVDTAIYSGRLQDYNIGMLADGSFFIHDLRAGAPDGSDILTGVEKLTFSDGGIDRSTPILRITTGSGDNQVAIEEGAFTDTIVVVFDNSVLGGKLTINTADDVPLGLGVSTGGGNDRVFVSGDLVRAGLSADWITYQQGIGQSSTIETAPPLTIDTGSGDDLINTGNIRFGGGSHGDPLRGWTTKIQLGSGNDEYFGSALDNVIIEQGPSPGGDVIGASGNGVTLDLAGLGRTAGQTGFSVNLATGQLVSPLPGHSVTLAGVSNLVGSAGNDTLTGDGSANILHFVSGIDSGAGGAQEPGRFDLGAANSIILVDLQTGIAFDLGPGPGAVFTDILFSGLEGWIGSSGADILRGDGTANLFFGGGGNDEIDGRGGNDAALYNSLWGDYFFQPNQDGSTTVTDQRSGAQLPPGTPSDGVDTLRGIEIVGFADGLRSLTPNAGAAFHVNAADWASGLLPRGVVGSSGNDSLRLELTGEVEASINFNPLGFGFGLGEAPPVEIRASQLDQMDIYAPQVGNLRLDGDLGAIGPLLNPLSVYGGDIDNDFDASGLTGRVKLESGGGADTLSGGKSNDILNGGAGIDGARYGSASADFAWWKAQDGFWRVQDLRTDSPLGTDQLIDVEVILFGERTIKLEGATPAEALGLAFEQVMRIAAPTGADLTFLNGLIASVNGAQKTLSQAYGEIVQRADGSTAVAAMAYQFFAGFAPSKGGFDFLVNPDGPNPNNLNSAYYQDFNTENRYINFAVNLGKVGQGRAAFEADYGSLTLRQATAKAYQEIFGGTAPNDAFLNLLLDADVGGGLTRKDYFAVYGGDGLTGLGTKAAMVGWLLTEAAKADVGTLVRSSNAYLADLADGAPFLVDMVGVYAQPDWAHNPPG